jgi:predicted nucleic acid-binding protein
MSKEIVVCDASPIISLERITNGFAFLEDLFDKVHIPEKVMEEVIKKPPFPPPHSIEAYLKYFNLENIVEIHSNAVDKTIPGILIFQTPSLDFKGEAYSITLARDLNLPVLFDDKQPRNFAVRLGLQPTNIGFQAVRAFQQGIIPQTRAKFIINALFTAGVFDTKQYLVLLSYL